MLKSNLWTLTCKPMVVLFAAFAMLAGCGDSNGTSVDEVQWNGDKGTFTDSRDGQSYKAIAIDSVIWMAENLSYKTENSKCYDEKADKCKYGRHYSWDEALIACPAGWHLPSKREFIALFAAVDMNNSEVDTSNAAYFIMEDVGYALKSQKGWVNEDGKSINGSDAYSFTALPAGCWNAEDLDFVLQGEQADFWSSTETDSNFSYCATIGENTYVNVISCDVKFGRSVRCVKD